MESSRFFGFIPLPILAVACLVASLLLARYRVLRYLPFKRMGRNASSAVSLLLVLCCPAAFVTPTALFALLPIQLINLHLFRNARPHQFSSPFEATSIGVWCAVAVLLYSPALLLLPLSAINLLTMGTERNGRSFVALFIGFIATLTCILPFGFLFPESIPAWSSAFLDSLVPQPFWEAEPPSADTLFCVVPMLLCLLVAAFVRLLRPVPADERSRHCLNAQLRYLFLLPFALFWAQHTMGLFLMAALPVGELTAHAFRGAGKKIRVWSLFVLLIAPSLAWLLLFQG